LREAVPPGGYFAAVTSARRFPAALAATCAELRTAGVGPAELEQAAAAAGRPASAAKLVELARVVRHADRALATAGFSHPPDPLWAAAARVAAGGGGGGGRGCGRRPGDLRLHRVERGGARAAGGPRRPRAGGVPGAGRRRTGADAARRAARLARGRGLRGRAAPGGAAGRTARHR